MIEKFKWLKNKKYKIKIGNFWEATEGFRSTNDMRSDWLSPNPLHITDPLVSTKKEKMKRAEDKIYLDKIDEIRDSVYEFYNMSSRRDLIMVYEMQEDKIYSYIYEDYLNSLNQRSQEMLKDQYEEATRKGEIVLFIRDKLRKKFKSLNI